MASRASFKKGASEFTLIRQTKASLMLIAKQTEAQEWIQSVLNEKFRYKDFGKSLEDGTLLCRLALAIQPGSIKKINSSSTKWKFIENLQAFVDFCQAYGVPQPLLFLPQDLIEEANMMKVVGCIHHLAALAAKKGFQPTMETTEIEQTELTSQAKQELEQQMAEIKKKQKEDEEKKRKLREAFSDDSDSISNMISSSISQPRDTGSNNNNHNAAKSPLPSITTSTVSSPAATLSPTIEKRERATSGIAKRLHMEDSAGKSSTTSPARSPSPTPVRSPSPTQQSATKPAIEVVTDAPQSVNKQAELDAEAARVKAEQEKAAAAALEAARKQQEVEAAALEEKRKQEEEQRRASELARIDAEAKALQAKKQQEIEQSQSQSQSQSQPQSQPQSPQTSSSSTTASTEPDPLQRSDSGGWLKRTPSSEDEVAGRRRSKVLMGDRTSLTGSSELSRVALGGGFSFGSRLVTETEKVVEKESPSSQRSSYSAQSSMDDVVLKRRTWKIRLESSNKGDGNKAMDKIGEFYRSMKASAEEMNKEEVIEQQIKRNKEDIIKELTTSRMEVRDVNEQALNAEEEEADRKERMRIEAINEIFLSEKYYVRDLETVVKVFLKPLRNAGDLLPPQQIDALFSNIELIWKVNNEIKNSMISDFQAADNIQLMNIGKVFLGMVDYLRIYSIYSSQHNASMKLYDQLKRENKNFLAFLSDAESKPDVRGLNLLGFLIKPIQRICKYPLLFKELLKYTPPDHVDYESLQKCYQKVEEVADYVNEKKRETDSLAKTLEIQENLTDTKGWNVVSPGRTYIKEGVLTALDASGKQQKERYFFLFSDVLLSTTAQFSKNKPTYKFKAAIPLMNCSLLDLPKTTMENAFELTIRGSDKESKLLLQASTANEKTHWVSTLQNVLNTLGASPSMKRNTSQTIVGSLSDSSKSVLDV